MSDELPKRLQEIFAALVAARIAGSLEQVEAALAAWRRGETDALHAHGEVLRHAARSGALSTRVARAGMEGPVSLLRDALDAGVIDEDEFTRLTGKEPSQVSAPPSLDEELAAEAPPVMPAKRTVIGKLMDDGPVLVHLDPRREGVDVPATFRGKPQLVLRFGYGLSPPIPDLSFDDERLLGTLTFRGVPHRCFIPWPAVYAIVAEDGRGLVWPDDVPPEVAEEFRDKAGAGVGAGRGSGAPGEAPPPPDPEPTKPKRGGHLKLV